MTLEELAKEYRYSAALLKNRIETLRETSKDASLCEMEKLRLRIRIGTLQSLLRETNEAAVYMEHYYDRRYKKHGRFAI